MKKFNFRKKFSVRGSKFNFKKKSNLNRYRVLLIIFFIIAVVIIGRLVFIQVFGYQNYLEEAEGRSTSVIPIAAPRGNILTSDGDLLATNKEINVLTFTDTQESMKDFYNTMNTVFEMLKNSGDISKIQDDFQLKINSQGQMYFDFPINKEKDPTAWQNQEIQFMWNRGIEGSVANKMYPKANGTYTTAEREAINKVILKYTPNDIFYDLVKSYGLINMLNINKNLTAEQQTAFTKAYKDMSGKEETEILLQHFSLQEIREFMSVKDQLKLETYSGYDPVPIAKGISSNTALMFDQRETSLPGVTVQEQYERYYPYGTLASHEVGYIGHIPASQSQTYADQGYNPNALVGISGMEAAEQDYLRGTPGEKVVQVNAQGMPIKTLYTKAAEPGDNVYLTINKNLEYSATRGLEQQMKFIQHVQGTAATKGALVAVNVHTGGILAMVSLPGYNPNDFASGSISQTVYNKYFDPDIAKVGQEFIDKMHLSKTLDQMFPVGPNGQREDLYNVLAEPMFNNATMGLFAPGSNYKPLVSVAALMTGVTTPEYTVNTTPYPFTYEDTPTIFGDDPPHDNQYFGDGVDLATALERSCDDYFYNMAAKIYYKFGASTDALDVIANYAEKFGLGTVPGSGMPATTGIELPENFGNAYNFQDWKANEIFYSQWTLVSDLQAGKFPSQGINFVPINVGTNSGDSAELAAAKSALKKTVYTQLNKIGVSDIQSNVAQTAFQNQLINDLNTLYKNSPEYQAAFKAAQAKNSKLTLADNIQATARAIDIWVASTMYTSIRTPAQLGYSAIGQGADEFTPLQMAQYVATLANGGTRYKLHLLDKVTSPTGKLVYQYKPQVMDKVAIPKVDLDDIKYGMEEVNGKELGTAYVDMDQEGFPIPSGGKTGTAALNAKVEKSVGRAAWGNYICFAPVKDPQIAIFVTIYNGEHGFLAAPAARAVMETYFRDEITTKDPSYQPVTENGVETNEPNAQSHPYTYSLEPPTPDVTLNGTYYPIYGKDGKVVYETGNSGQSYY
ncbi:MAG: penicillin-binding transpeptidase domain-containing protein [Sarcina sp.]